MCGVSEVVSEQICLVFQRDHRTPMVKKKRSERRPGSKVLDVLEDNDHDAALKRQARTAARSSIPRLNQPETPKAELRRQAEQAMAEWAAAQSRPRLTLA